MYVQRAVLRQLRGGAERAVRLSYSSVLEAIERKGAAVDVTVAAVAQTNVAAMDAGEGHGQGAGELDVALKRANRTHSQALAQKLTTAQVRPSCSLSFHAFVSGGLVSLMPPPADAGRRTREPTALTESVAPRCVTSGFGHLFESVHRFAAKCSGAFTADKEWRS